MGQRAIAYTIMLLILSVVLTHFGCAADTIYTQESSVSTIELNNAQSECGTGSKYALDVLLDKTRLYRGENLTISYVLTNIGKNRIGSSNIDLPIPSILNNCRVVSASPNCHVRINLRKLSLVINNLAPKESIGIAFQGYVSPSASLGEYRINDLRLDRSNLLRHKTCMDANTSSLEILNNYPRIINANVAILSPCIYDAKTNSLNPIDEKSPIVVRLSTNAIDIEDEYLSYLWKFKNDTSYCDNIEINNTSSVLCYLKGWPLNNNYSFELRAIDSDGGYCIGYPIILYGKYSAEHIFLINYQLYENSIQIVLFGFLLILITAFIMYIENY